MSLESLHLGTFDVIVNDFAGARDKVADWIIEHLSGQGTIIWDNSDRAAYQGAIEQIKALGFGSIEFFGLVPVNPYASGTMILSRQLVSPTWPIRPKKTVAY